MCRSTNLRKLQPLAFDASTDSYVNIIECRDCTFAWQYPLERTEAQSTACFEMALADRGQTQSRYFDPEHKRDICRLEFEFLAKVQNTAGTLLDIGAGAGVFAEVCTDHGWKVTAVDPAIDPEKFVGNSSIRAVKGTIPAIPAGDEFDVVTLWDVIEHAIAPVELISTAARYLKPQGWLLIETGNYKSSGRVAGGDTHWIYQLDHRWYFSPESIYRLLVDAGFSKFKFCETVLRPGWTGKVTYPGPSGLQLLRRILSDPLHINVHFERYRALRRAMQWEYPGIEIFAVAATRG